MKILPIQAYVSHHHKTITTEFEKYNVIVIDITSFYTHGARKKTTEIVNNYRKIYINIYEYLNIAKRLNVCPTSLIVNVLLINAGISTNSAELPLKDKINSILIKAQVLHLSISKVLSYVSKTLCLRKKNVKGCSLHFMIHSSVKTTIDVTRQTRKFYM